MNPNTASRAAIQRRNSPPSSPQPLTVDMLRARRVLSRVAVSEALAAEIASMAFASADRWGARA